MERSITKRETGRSPRCDKIGLKKGPWTPEEDQKLLDYIAKNGPGSWKALPKRAGLNRCGKSIRLRWTNYLRPGIKRGKFSQEEEQTILNLHAIIGNNLDFSKNFLLARWSAIASHLPGRTDNGVKNIWNTRLKKKLIRTGYDPMTHQPRQQLQPQEALTNTSSVNSNTFTNVDNSNHIIDNLPMVEQFPNTMSCFETGGLQLVYDDGSFSHHMPCELKTCAQHFSYDTVQDTETIALSHGESSASYPRLLSCSSTTASPSHVAPPVTETSLTNMTDNCNASGLYMAPGLLIEDPLFNVI